jgi:alanine dehydrogenase
MVPPPVLLLTRRDVAELLPLDDCIAAVAAAFRAHGEGRADGPRVLGLEVPGGGFHVKAAGLTLSRRYFAVKINANFALNAARLGLPTIQGMVALFDGERGSLLAVMDSMEITALRSGAATAVAAVHLARADAASVAVCGCGKQGRVQLAALARVRRIERASVFDIDADRARKFAQEMSAELGIHIEVGGSPTAVAERSDIVVTCTPSREALLQSGDIRAGTFVAAVGADAPDKRELDPRLVASCKIVVDHAGQCREIGEIHHALAAGVMSVSDIHAELGEIVAGMKPGRVTRDEITLFDSTGTALQDVAAASIVYERAVERPGARWLELAS